MSGCAYIELSADAEAAELALALARFYIRHGDIPADGRFRGNARSGGILPTAVGIARLGRWMGEEQLATDDAIAEPIPRIEPGPILLTSPLW